MDLKLIGEYAGLIVLLIAAFTAFVMAMADAQEQIEDETLLKSWNARIEEPQIARHGEDEAPKATAGVNGPSGAKS